MRAFAVLVDDDAVCLGEGDFDCFEVSHITDVLGSVP